MTSTRYLLLDRDGTLIVEVNNLHEPEKVQIIPGAIEALLQFAKQGWRFVVVTNQSGVARGIFTLEQMHSVNHRVDQILRSEGIQIDGFYACTHAPEISACNCRKPKPGLVEQAVADHKFDPRNAVMVGDKALDIGLGKAVGARTVLVRTGHGLSAEKSQSISADYVFDSLAKLTPEAFEI